MWSDVKSGLSRISCSTNVFVGFEAISVTLGAFLVVTMAAVAGTCSIDKAGSPVVLTVSPAERRGGGEVTAISSFAFVVFFKFFLIVIVIPLRFISLPASLNVAGEY